MRKRPSSLMLPMAVIFVILLFSSALAEDAPVKYTWSAPTTGSAVKLYRVEMCFGDEENGTYGPWGEMGTTTETDFTFSFTKGIWYKVRVRAEDHEGILGPYSDPSVPFSVSLDSGGEPVEGFTPLPPDTIRGPVELKE